MKTRMKAGRTAAVALAGLMAGTAWAETPMADLTWNADSANGHYPLPERFSVVCESDKYDAHATSVMLEDDRTIFAFWDLAHGGPCGRAAKSTDAGRTWTRIDGEMPAELVQFHDAPVAFRFIDPKTKKSRLRVFAGYLGERPAKDVPLKNAMPSLMSEDDGRTWKFVEPMGEDFICVISFFGMERLKDGTYLGVYQRGPHANGDGSPLQVMSSVSRDGGVTWEKGRLVAVKPGYELCEPAVFYSPDQKELCCLIRENSGRHPSQMCFSKDEGRTWSEVRDAPLAMNGHRHVVQKLQDGRYLVVFRKVDGANPHVYGWIGPYKSIRDGSGKGGVLVKLFHNYGSPWDCGYQGMHMRKNGEIVITTYVKHRPQGPTPSIVAMHFHPSEIDQQLKEREKASKQTAKFAPFEGTKFRPLTRASLYGPFIAGLAKGGLDRNAAVKAAGKSCSNAESKTGAYDLAKLCAKKTGAAYVVWTVKAAKAGKARLRVIGAPSAAFGVNGQAVFPETAGTMFDARTAEVTLRKGDNEIVAFAKDAGGVVAAALDGIDFTCVKPAVELDLSDDGMDSF